MLEVMGRWRLRVAMESVGQGQATYSVCSGGLWTDIQDHVNGDICGSQAV